MPKQILSNTYNFFTSTSQSCPQEHQKTLQHYAQGMFKTEKSKAQKFKTKQDT